MPGLVIPNVARLAHANVLRTYFNANTFLRLFTNNHVPVRADVASDYTQAVFGGYAPIALTSWGAASLLGDWHAQLSEILRQFVCTAAPLTDTIYGYYVVDGAGVLQWAELGPLPIAIDAINKSYSVIPKYTYISEFGP